MGVLKCWRCHFPIRPWEPTVWSTVEMRVGDEMKRWRIKVHEECEDGVTRQVKHEAWVPKVGPEGL